MDQALLRFFQQDRDLLTDHRPLRLRLAHSAQVLEDVLLPQYVQGGESICGGIEYRILCVSVNAFIPLKELIALPAVIEIVTDRGDLRSICGVITEARAGDSDGGLASYQLVLRDAFSIMEKRSNTRVFRGMNELEIVQLIMMEWRHSSSVIAACFKSEVDALVKHKKYPQREFTMQYNESDAAFIRRLLKRRGIAWYFRGDGGRHHPAHTMVLFNHPQSLKQSGAGVIRYHRDNATERRDTITSWCAIRSLQAGRVSRFSWDYREPWTDFTMRSAAESGVDQGASGNELSASLDDYQVLAPHAGNDMDDLRRLGQLAMRWHDYESKCFRGEGSVRDLCVGEYFELEGHPEIDKHPDREREFSVTALQLAALNNLPKTLTERAERLYQRSPWIDLAGPAMEAMRQGETRVRVHFTAVRRGIDIVPAYDPRTDLPQVPMQSAHVVGPEGEVVFCDELGRVKIRFKSTRAKDHEHAQGSGAGDSNDDSAWVRVASNWAGNGPGSVEQCGNLTLPRVGSEVLVAFLGGDPDKPVIVGQLYNQIGKPPALSGAGKLPGTRYLSGVRSHEIKGQRGNQLIFDDTRAQISAQLASDHAGSQLNLGALTEPKSHGSANPRGEGAELLTQAHVAVRGAKGILMTAFGSSRPAEKQLERAGLLQLLEDCEQLSKSLAEYAAEHRGLSHEPKPLADLKAAIDGWENGTITSKSAGQAAPVIAITAPDGVVHASGGSAVSYAAKNIDQVAQQNLQFASAGRSLINAGKGISLFSHSDGIHQIAQKVRVLIQSQSDSTDINASKDLTLTSSEGKIVGLAKEIVLIAEDGSFIKIGDGITLGTSGTINYHASKHPFKGGKTMSAALPKFGSGGTNLRVATTYESGTPRETAAPNRKVRIEHENGQVVEANSDSAGKTSTMSSDEMSQVVVTPLEGEER